MTNKMVAGIISGVVTICITMATVFVFGSGDLRRTGKCTLTMFIHPDWFSYFDVPILSITTILMLYAYYNYYTMARKTKPEGSAANAHLKVQVKVTKTMFTVIGVFLSSNIIYYTVFFIIYGMDLEGFGISLIYWFADGLWLVCINDTYFVSTTIILKHPKIL